MIYHAPLKRKTAAAIILALIAMVAVPRAIAAALEDEPIKPLPPVGNLDAKKVALGGRLFGEKRLSENNDVSCNSCHNFATMGGGDSRPRSVGTGAKLGPVNSPTVLNARFNFVQQWAGGAPTMLDLTHKIVKNPVVLGTTWDVIVSKLEKDDVYRKLFAEAYAPAPISSDTVADALLQFELSLVTPSRFDDFLLGNSNAITEHEKQGYAKFKDYGCVACHQGANVGGNMLQKFGILGDYLKDRGNITPADAGRFNVTKKEEDRGVFRVPSLRNVALTAPYFHDGAAPTLESAVEVMLKYQLGRTASPVDKAAIIAFLKSLSADPAQLRAIDSMVRPK